MTKFESLLSDFEKAVGRFGEVLALEKNDIVRDSAIQRFEFSFELCWKTLKAFLEEYHNVRCVSPRKCFREAFNQGIINYSDFWIEMTKLRNETVHTYNEKIAEEIYKQLPPALSHFKILLDAMLKIKE
ncbi:MAG: HI0074 family nucleotidyltransferase substrate-binding subunit [Patescibacteria group bacterium]|nr:HI0074 family nucleotidyltransferase substrate-binding subunit [Patescibacteria group bacterium]